MRRSDATEKKIIQAALELFVRKGYHGASISDITRQVGLTKGALYAHLKSKGELLLKIIDQFDKNFIDQLIKTGENTPGTAADKLHRILSFSTAFANDNKDLCVFLTFLTFELSAYPEFEEALKSIYRKYQKAISKVIKQGQKEGSFKNELDADMAALTFISIHDGTLHQWALNRERLDSVKFVRNFRRIIFTGLMQ
jgi:AcrR family transcriptional regulator